MAGVIAIVLIGGYIVIQSIFRISINDKIKSYGQLRTIGATPKQIKRIVKNGGTQTRQYRDFDWYSAGRMRRFSFVSQGI